MDNSLHICETTTAIFCGLFRCGQKMSSCCSRLNTKKEILNLFSYEYHLVKIVVFLKMHHAHKCDGNCLIQPTNACTFIWSLQTHNVKHNVVLFPQKKVIISSPVLEFELWGWISDKSHLLWVHIEHNSNTASGHVFNDGFIVLLPFNSIVGCTFHMLESYTGLTSFTNRKWFLAVMISFSTNICSSYQLEIKTLLVVLDVLSTKLWQHVQGMNVSIWNKQKWWWATAELCNYCLTPQTFVGTSFLKRDEKCKNNKVAAYVVLTSCLGSKQMDTSGCPIHTHEHKQIHKHM